MQTSGQGEEAADCFQHVLCGVCEFPECFSLQNFPSLTGASFCSGMLGVGGQVIAINGMLGVGGQAIASYSAAAMSESGGKGELDKSKIVGKERSKREVIDGTRDGLIGGDGSVCGHGHGRGQDQNCNCCASSPLASVASRRMNTVPLTVPLNDFDDDDDDPRLH